MISVNILSFVLMMFAMLGVVLVIAERSWTRGREDGIDYTMETLIDQGLIIAEYANDDIKISPAKDVIVSDLCNRCNEGWIYNPALTKAQGALGDD